MNANELADELKEVSKHSEPHTQIVLGITESFLRQQQAEIEVLKSFYEDRLEAGKKREETLLKTIEVLLRKAQEK